MPSGSCRATALHYIGGLLKHARGFCAITNPLVNSYKRLVPGYEAPVNVAWSMRNRSPLIRIPERRGPGTRVELRMPDPAANPYLALAVMLAAGLDGVETQGGLARAGERRTSGRCRIARSGVCASTTCRTT